MLCVNLTPAQGIVIHSMTKLKTLLLVLALTISQTLFSAPLASAQEASLENPLNFNNSNGNNGFADFLNVLVGALQIVIVPFVVIFIIYAGFMYVAARGNPETIQKANRALIYAIIGGVIILGAEAIGIIIENTVQPFEKV